MKNQVPTFQQMYFNDVIFKNFLQLAFGPIVFFIAIALVEPMFRLIIAAFTIPLSLIGIILVIHRYNLVRSTFRDGIAVKAKVLYRQNIANYSENSRAVKSRSYYLNIGYKVHGVDYQKRVVLPTSFFLYGIKHDGQEFDVMVKETAPKHAFVRHIYLDYDPTTPNE